MSLLFNYTENFFVVRDNSYLATFAQQIFALFSSNKGLEEFIPIFTIKTIFPNNSENIYDNTKSTVVFSCSAHEACDLSNKVFNITY